MTKSLVTFYPDGTSMLQTSQPDFFRLENPPFTGTTLHGHFGVVTGWGPKVLLNHFFSRFIRVRIIVHMI